MASRMPDPGNLSGAVVSVATWCWCQNKCVCWTDRGFHRAESGGGVLLWQVNCNVTLFCADQPRGTLVRLPAKLTGAAPRHPGQQA